MLRRSVFVLVGMLLCAGSISQAQEPRAAPANDLFNSRIPLPRDSSGTIATMEDATAHEADEPVASCAIDGNDSDSVWFRMDLPDGTLTFTAVGTGFVPVITLYQSEGPMLDLLPEIACVTNTASTVSPITTVLTASVTAGRYIVRVAFDDLVLPIADYPMNYAFSFTPPAGIAVPANDSVENAKPILFNKIAKTNNVEYSTFDESDPPHTCGGDSRMFHSVWYTFNVEDDNTDITLATEGSMYNEAQAIMDRANVMIFKDSLGSLAPMGCFTGGGMEGAANGTLQIDTGLYKLAVFGDNAAGLDGPSGARIIAVVHELRPLDNSSFDVSLAPWKLKNASGDGIITGPDSIDGSSFRFTGGPGEASKLKQSIVPDSFIVPADTLLEFAYSYRHITLMDVAPSYVIKVTLASGIVRSFKGNLLLGNVGGFSNFVDQFVLADKGTVKIQLIIKNKATTGVYVLDEPEIVISPFGYGLRDSGVLPLPPPPTR